MIRFLLNNFFFIPKFFPHIKFQNKIRPYFGLPKRKYGGPNIRTKKMIKFFGNYFFSPNIIYAQSWWSEIELKDAIDYSKKNSVPVVFNQNGWFYPAWYKKDWKKRNNTIIKIHKISKKVIFQSKFCKYTSVKLNNYYNKSNTIIYNPALIKKENKILKNKIFKIIVTGVFGEESEHILLTILKAINHIHKKNLATFKYTLNIYGVIKKDMKNSSWFSEYKKIFQSLNEKQLVFFHGKYKHDDVHDFLHDTNLALHVKFKDPCPNAVIEKLQYGIPHIFSNSGGTPELIQKAGIPINVKNSWRKMKSVNYLDLSKKIILAKKNYKILRKLAFKQGRKFGIKNYIYQHKRIFKSLKN